MKLQNIHYMLKNEPFDIYNTHSIKVINRNIPKYIKQMKWPKNKLE